MGITPKRQIVRDAIRRFSRLENRTIARHILYTHGDLFEQDIEKIRGMVRRERGRSGDRHRELIADKSLFIKDGDRLKPPASWNREVKPYPLPVGTGLVLSDLHVPFHELKPLEAAMQSGHAEKIEWILFNGDFADCSAVSYWPTAHRDFNSEIEAVIDMLDFIRYEFQDCKIIYKPGNHEYRLPRYFISHAPDLVETPISAMETVLGFESRDIEFLDYFQLVQAGKLPILHGHELRNLSSMVNPARGLFLKAKTFAACSHCHSSSEHNAKNIHDELLTTWSFACLCNLHPDYNPFGNDWGWGFAIINVEKNGDFEVINRRILPSGKVV